MKEGNAGTLRVATYNVHGCVGTTRERSEGRIAEVIDSMSVDVVGLQELDMGRKRSAGVDQARLIAQQLGWHHLFESAIRVVDEHYGIAILSRYPLTHRQTIPLPGEGSWYCRETRVALWAEAATPAGAVQIINTHLGLGRQERLVQARHISGLLEATPSNEPLVLLGDFNSRPSSRALQPLRKHLRDLRTTPAVTGSCRTFPTRYPLVAVDHIFVSPALHPISLTVHRQALARIASDHYPLVAELARTQS